MFRVNALYFIEYSNFHDQEIELKIKNYTAQTLV